MRVREVMTYGAIGLPETATIAEAAETMLKARISAVLVRDADNALVGVLSSGDLMRRAESAPSASARAGSSRCSAAAGSPNPTPTATGARSARS